MKWAYLALGQAIGYVSGLAADADILPAATLASPAYATTTTKVSSTTQSTAAVVQFISPRVVTIITTISATSLIPGPVTTFPATVVETVKSRITFEFRTTYSGGSRETSFSSSTITIPQTWVVAQPRPTDLAAGTSGEALPCDECARSRAAPADPICEAKGLHTGCQGQCERRDGAWWCYQLFLSDYRDAAKRMGRACWGGGGRYEQLNTPCDAGDYRMACTPCQGLDDGWGARDWSGPAGNP